MTRILVLIVALVFIGGLAFLTFSAIASQGFTLAGFVSIFIVALLAIGIIGALINPPRQ
jgi:hypothetical protein